MHQEYGRSQKRYRILIFCHLPLNLLKLPAVLSAVWIFFSIFASRKNDGVWVRNETEKIRNEVIMKQRRRKYIQLLTALLLLLIGQEACAQKTCVIASAENHVPIREALIHTNNNHWARTDYRGYWSMRYQFDSATVSKPGFIKATIRYRELPDTVFLLPESKQIGEVTVWGKNQENAGKMKGQACQEAVEAGRNAALGHTRLVGFDLGNMMDSQGRRDQKHLKEAKKIFSKMEHGDPLINAYEKATGKKYLLKNPVDAADEKPAEKQPLKGDEKANVPKEE